MAGAGRKCITAAWGVRTNRRRASPIRFLSPQATGRCRPFSIRRLARAAPERQRPPRAARSSTGCRSSISRQTMYSASSAMPASRRTGSTDTCPGAGAVAVFCIFSSAEDLRRAAALRPDLYRRYSRRDARRRGRIRAVRRRRRRSRYGQALAGLRVAPGTGRPALRRECPESADPHFLAICQGLAHRFEHSVHRVPGR